MRSKIYLNRLHQAGLFFQCAAVPFCSPTLAPQGCAGCGKCGNPAGGPLLPGHGTTAQDLNRTRWQDWVTASEKVYQQLAKHCQKVILAGESAGAMIVLYLAVQHPEAAAVLA